jgi:hypothetical protein
MTYGSFKLRVLIVCLVAIMLSTAINSASAQSLRDLDANHRSGAADGLQLIGSPKPLTYYTYTVTIPDTYPVADPPPAAGTLDVLRSRFPGWTFTAASAGEPGTLDIISYDGAFVRKAPAGHAGHVLVQGDEYARLPGGVEIVYPNFLRVQYTAPVGGLVLPAGHSLQWIQFVLTNWPAAGPDGTGPANSGRTGGGFDPAGGNFPAGTVLPLPWTVFYIDPYDYNHGMANGPFYLTADEQLAARVLAGDNDYTSLTFVDAPRRALCFAVPGSQVVWMADLYLAEWDGVTNVTLYDGVRWGFRITATSAASTPPAGPGWTMGGVAGDKFDIIDGPMNVNATLVSTYVGGVGGFAVPVDKLGLLSPYIGLASTIMIGAVATVVYVKRVKRRKEKQ